jgi:hypothetical protein
VSAKWFENIANVTAITTLEFCMSTSQTENMTRDLRSGVRISAILLIVCSLMEMIFMAHHPTVHAQNISDALVQMSHVAIKDKIVHGALILLMYAVLFGLYTYAYRRGLQRAGNRFGLLAYFTGVAAFTGAALIDGFLLPDFAAYAASAINDEAPIRAILALIRTSNQVLAVFGSVATSIGILFWSIDLLRDQLTTRVLAVYGSLMGASICVALLSGALHLNVGGMSIVVYAQAFWASGLGLLMLKNRV